MCPCSEMVCRGYIRIPDKGSILTAHGFDLRQGVFKRASPNPELQTSDRHGRDQYCSRADLGEDVSEQSTVEDIMDKLLKPSLTMGAAS